jgi:hypothetical protein
MRLARRASPLPLCLHDAMLSAWAEIARRRQHPPVLDDTWQKASCIPTERLDRSLSNRVLYLCHQGAERRSRRLRSRGQAHADRKGTGKRWVEGLTIEQMAPDLEMIDVR